MCDDTWDFEKITCLTDYEDFVTSLASPESMKDFQSKLTTGALGLAGESGEIADTVKKILFHNLEMTEEIRQRLIAECGDVCWYIAFIARNVLGSSIQEIIDHNISKLQKRYKSGKFTTEEALAKEYLKPTT
jgi:NTP pyrophosphatase (non-canonical NTP hydrolase)